MGRLEIGFIKRKLDLGVGGKNGRLLEIRVEVGKDLLGGWWGLDKVEEVWVCGNIVGKILSW